MADVKNTEPYVFFNKKNRLGAHHSRVESTIAAKCSNLIPITGIDAGNSKRVPGKYFWREAKRGAEQCIAVSDTLTKKPLQRRTNHF